ncbi:hypothetical protein BD779DRAFT_375885 [Infundibulicybe gibba]|nr:hypothetical protein BD779DRAFT_375885 [Infundibulicybe gibba]
MCYAYGSVDQAINVCPMCKVFPHSRCPHIRETCRNRTLHPRIDVLFLKNAEVDSFNGCGYCKWARTNPPPKQAGYHNPGWPGCCRPPAPSEYRLIQAADWRSVSIVHHVSIPPEIKAALDSLSIRGNPIPTGGRSSSANSKSGMPVFDRRNSGNSSPSSRSSTLSKSSSVSITGKVRPGGSPQQLPLAFVNNLSRTSSGNAISSSVPTASSMEQYQNQRRQALMDSPDRRVEGTHSSQSSPSRRHIDLDTAVTPRRSSVRRPAVTPATASVSVSPVSVDSRSQNAQSPVRRRASVSNSNPPAKSTPSPRPADRPTSFMIPRSAKKDEDSISSASSSSGSDGRGSMTDSTVTSDGGFTDYLSDESEAELQRQAEARAALVAQNQAEEMEFKAARQQLAHVDLRPPKSWNPTNIPTMPRHAWRPELIPPIPPSQHMLVSK